MVTISIWTIVAGVNLLLLAGLAFGYYTRCADEKDAR